MVKLFPEYHGGPGVCESQARCKTALSICEDLQRLRGVDCECQPSTTAILGPVCCTRQHHITYNCTMSS